MYKQKQASSAQFAQLGSSCKLVDEHTRRINTYTHTQDASPTSMPRTHRVAVHTPMHTLMPSHMDSYMYTPMYTPCAHLAPQLPLPPLREAS